MASSRTSGFSLISLSSSLVIAAPFALILFDLRLLPHLTYGPLPTTRTPQPLHVQHLSPLSCIRWLLQQTQLTHDSDIAAARLPPMRRLPRGGDGHVAVTISEPPSPQRRPRAAATAVSASTEL